MDRWTYYENLKALARAKRTAHGVKTETLGLRELRRVYRAEMVAIHLWKHKVRKLRAVYYVDDDEAHVMVSAALPLEPRLFSLAHELKHHYTDRDKLQQGLLGCREYESSRGVPVIEIGAEVFAAEFIFPEEEFRTWVNRYVPEQGWSPEAVVRLKRTCPAKVSYSFIVKRLERLHYIKPGMFAGVQFVNLERRLYGLPFRRRSRQP